MPRKRHRAEKRQRGKRRLVYGSLYLGEREPYELAEQQIDTCLELALRGGAQKRVSLIFDVVATPEQVAGGEPHQVAQHILTYVDVRYPYLDARAVGITDDDARRPMRDILLTQTLTLSAVDEQHLFILD